jgi:hypothetical protein
VDDVVQVPLAAQVALHGVEAQLEQGHPAGAELLADDLVDRPLDGRWRGLNLLGPAVQDLEVVVLGGDLVGAGGHQIPELPEGLHRQLEALIVGNGPQDVGSDRPTYVDM